jgi:DNA polymerase-1
MLNSLDTCTACPLHLTARQAVKGEGPVPATIMVVGEAPGAEEDKKGRPFIGRSGARLDAMLSIAGILRKQVYVTNLVKHRPPMNRAPHKKAEVSVCAKWLEQELELVQPEILILLGASAVSYFLPKAKITKDHGMPEQLGNRWQAASSKVRPLWIVPMYHPAASLHNPNLLPIMQYDFERLGKWLRGQQDPVPETNYQLGDADDARDAVYKTGIMGFDLETTSPMRRRWFAAEQAEIVGYSTSSIPLQAYYVPEQPLAPSIVSALQDPNLVKVCHNSKFEYARLKQLGITMQNFRDTKIAANLLQFPDTSLKALARQVLGVDPITYEEVTQGQDMSSLRPEEIVEYAAADADNTLRLDIRFQPQIDAHRLRKVHDEIEIPLVPVIADMELHGVLVDEAATELLLHDLEHKREADKVVLQTLLNVENPASTEQVARALEKLQAPLQDRTASKKHFVIDDDKLLEIEHWNADIVNSLLNFRRNGKRSSYLRNFLDLRGVDGRLHPGVQQAGGYEEGRAKGGEAPATGRLSYSGPNLQNIPHRGDTNIVNAMRNCLVASPGKVLMCADASQEEARILSLIANDEQMRRDFDSGRPIYGFIGQELFGKPITKRDNPQEWFVAKTYFLAYIYGADYAKLLEIDKAFGSGNLDLRTAVRGARRLRERYSRIEPYRREVAEDVLRRYSLSDYFGRIRNFPKLGSDDPSQRQEAHREAFNFTIQAPAASVMKIAMRKVWENLPSDCHLLMSIHDEVVVELPPDKVDEVANVCYNAFQGIIPIELPIECNIGESWGNLEFYDVHLVTT